MLPICRVQGQPNPLRAQSISRCVRTGNTAPSVGLAPPTRISRAPSVHSMAAVATPNGRLAETAEPDPLAKTEDAEMTVR